jgi:DNA-binding response OmpR family regulator
MNDRPLDVLIVEDDPGARAVLAHHLAGQGWSVRVAPDGEAALAEAAARAPDVVVLDVMLPGVSGIEVCAALRERLDPSPGVLILTARDGEADLLLAFDSGADDYVVKPCRPREVVARLRALARRVGRRDSERPRRPERAPAEEPAMLRHGALRVDTRARRAFVGEQALHLTPTELELLVLFASEPERSYSRLELLKDVWDSTHPGYARNVDCHVARLRRKLAAAGLKPTPIETVHGTGYRFALAEGAC